MTGAQRIRVIRRLGGYMLRYKPLIALILLLMMTSNILSLIGPTLSGAAIDAIEPGQGKVDFPSVFLYCGLMLIFYVVSAALAYINAQLMIRLSQRITKTMRREVFEHLTTLPVNYFDVNQTGEIISHISYDIDTVNASLSNDVIQICTSAITIIGSLIMMVKISPLLLLVFCFTVPMSILFTRYRAKKVQPLFRRRSAMLGALNGYAEEMLSGQKTIKAYNREAVIVDRFDGHNANAVNAYYEADYQGCIIGPSVNFINNLSLSLISMFGAMLYMFGRVTLGNVSSFIQYSRRFSGPINEMANIFAELQSACAAAERVFRLLDEPSEKPDAENAVVLTDARGEVKLDHVRFGYTEDRIIIGDLSLDVAPGKMIAIVGPTGAGKTTIINLLMRFYDPQSGTISVDGHDICNVTRDSLRAAYTMVLQETWLFCGTIFDNIAYGKEGATEEEVIAAAKAAKIHTFIESLPDGYQTVLSDDGTGISKGQKQLLTIARAMLADVSMLILDEATSNVDSRTEIRIQEAMVRLMQGRTCFVIAHRLSTIKGADCILVLDGGNVAEMGTHDELLQKEDGIYSKLFRAQFQN
ncbi:MAG: ABC transporter ATP-binding protein [Clostridia bacterium]|nr:ABC transporter ATP-binding protein [Clostridia bacterium]